MRKGVTWQKQPRTVDSQTHPGTTTSSQNKILGLSEQEVVTTYEVRELQQHHLEK